jgi:hypothetical protein
VRDAIETYRKLAGERVVIPSESKSATLLAVQFQSAESLRLARRAEIDLRWPALPRRAAAKVCGLCGPFETLEACLVARRR